MTWVVTLVGCARMFSETSIRAKRFELMQQSFTVGDALTSFLPMPIRSGVFLDFFLVSNDHLD